MRDATTRFPLMVRTLRDVRNLQDHKEVAICKRGMEDMSSNGSARRQETHIEMSENIREYRFINANNEFMKFPRI